MRTQCLNHRLMRQLLGAAVTCLAVTCLAVICFAVMAEPVPHAGADSTLAVTATFIINGRPVTHSSDSNPIRLDPNRPAQVSLTVVNRGPNPVTVGAVALSGRALDITFFDFETQIALLVRPGTTATQQYTLDFAPLNGQGDGLIPASIHILDEHRRVLASQAFTADVRGRITSLFGLFAIEVTLFTAILFVGALIALARGRLHENRFRRAVRFLWPGLALGIVIVFGFAILRIFVPRPGRWLPIVLVCGAIGFAIGYLTPNPAGDDPEAEPEPDRVPQPEPELQPRLVSEPGPQPEPHQTMPLPMPQPQPHQPDPQLGMRLPPEPERNTEPEPGPRSDALATDPRVTLTAGGLPARQPPLSHE